MTENTQQTETLLMNADEAASLLGIGRTLFYSMHSSGRLGPLPIRFGRRILWRQDELKRWISADCPARCEWIKN